MIFVFELSPYAFLICEGVFKQMVKVNYILKISNVTIIDVKSHQSSTFNCICPYTPFHAQFSTT